MPSTTLTSRCPECGTAGTAPPSIFPFWIRARRIGQAVALLIVLCLISWELGSNWPVLRNGYLHNPATVAVEFPAERFTRSDLQSMAEDATPSGEGDRLVRALSVYLDDPLDADAVLCAALISPEGDYSHSIRWGWPRNIVSVHYTATFKDVYTLSSPTPPALRGRKGWMFDAYWDEWIDPRLGRATLIVMPYSLVAPALLLAIAWLAGVLLLAALRLVTVVRRDGHRPRDRLARFIPLACTITGLITIAILSIPRPEPRHISYPAVVWPQTAPTGLTKSDLLALRGSVGADRVVARAILAAADTVPTTGDTLGWGLRHSRPHLFGQYLESGGRLDHAFDGFVTEFARRETSEPTRVRWHPGWERDRLTLSRVQTGPIERIDKLEFPIAGIAWPILSLFAAWILAGLPANLAEWWIRNRTRRRAARGDCIRCGYAGVAPPPRPRAGA